MFNRILHIAVAILLVASVSAQNSSSYSCDFENAAQNAQWTLVSGVYASQIAHKWVIGSAVNNTRNGSQAMYVSADNGVSNSYSATPSCIMAYTEVDLIEGKYSMSFDWLARGDNITKLEGLYVAAIPLKDLADKTIPINYNPNTGIPDKLKPYLCELTDDGGFVLNGRMSWRTATAEFESEGEPLRITFLWNVGNGTVRNPSASIDNISIVPSGACPMPSMLQLVVDTTQNNNNVQLIWDDCNVDRYDIRIFSHLENRWIYRTTADTTITIVGLAQGETDVYVRSVCEGNMMSMPQILTQFVYYPQSLCIDYFTMSDENCYVGPGEAPFYQLLVRDTRTPFFHWEHKRVDYGYQDALSRHTIHFDHDEYDYYTNYKLKVVPDEDIAVVRLGNDIIGSECERVEFRMHADKNKAQMLRLKYALVLEAPNHDNGKTEQDIQNYNVANPAFTLDILDEHGNSLGNCYDAVFSSGVQMGEGWHTEPMGKMERRPPQSGICADIRWKDWTTVGLNLEEYDGMDLIIRLTTYDCNATGHFGYAYFTLSCGASALDGLRCGEVNTSFVAPDGFKYRWYHQEDEKDLHDPIFGQLFDWSKIVSRDRIFEVDVNDDRRYCVDLMFAADTTCYFTLRASARPYYPHPDFTMEFTPKDCQNIYTFRSTANVVDISQVTGEVTPTDLKVDYVTWEFDDGTMAEVGTTKHVFPNEGGWFHVKQYAYLGECTPEVLDSLVYIPPIGTVFTDSLVIGCTTIGYQYGDSVFTKPTFYRDTLVAYTGCDSIVNLDIRLTEPTFDTIRATILDNQFYTFPNEDGTGTRRLSTAGEYDAVIPTLIAGCDSSIHLILRVHDILEVDMDRNYVLCADENSLTLPFSFIKGFSDYYYLKADATPFAAVGETPTLITQPYITLPVPQPITPNVYNITVGFVDTISGNVEKDVTLTVNYADTILQQKWNDVIAILSENYNGGYHFTGFQWYCNDTPIAGANGPYLYLEGSQLDLNATYYARLTRDDGVTLNTCPITPVIRHDVQQFPTIVGTAQRISRRFAEPSQVSFYTLSGTLYSTIALGEGEQTVVMPAHEGVYIMTVKTTSSTTRHKIVVR